MYFHWNLFSWQLLTICLHYKLYKITKVANFVCFRKTRMVNYDTDTADKFQK